MRSPLFGKAATAGITGGLLMRGTKNKSRQQIQDEMDRLKAQINVSGGATSASASIETIEANLPGALRLAAEILREPAFPDSEFETVRQQRIAGAEASRSDPQALALTEFQHRMNPYPRGDVRYVSTADEQIEDLKKVTLDDVRKFHQQFYGASVGEIAISGQFNAAGDFQARRRTVRQLEEPRQLHARHQHVYRRSSPPTRRSKPPTSRTPSSSPGEMVKINDEDPDYPAIVHGQLHVRRQRARHAPLAPHPRQGRPQLRRQFAVSARPPKTMAATSWLFAISNPQNAPKVEASFRDELAKTLKEGFTADEVAAAKKAWLQERGMSRSEDGSLVGLFAARQRFDRTLKFDESLEAKVAALTPEQITAAFRKHVDPADPDLRQGRRLQEGRRLAVGQASWPVTAKSAVSNCSR